jgi:carbon-monoxide dehydrogenase small subunit
MDGLPVSSCCTLALEADGRDLMTIEGLGDAGDLHPVQEAFLRHDALQCGFCTPGMILAVKALFDLEPAPSDDDITHFLHGNICRCTGYVKILEAVKELRDG